MIEIYAGTVVEKILLFKEQLWDIFDNSENKTEAYAKRDSLAKEGWWQGSWHLTTCLRK
ncbi:MAG: hypothetical protein AB1488_09605 [Nitrospirota bacterium]